MKDGTPRIQKYVLIPLPRTDARPRRFRLAAVDPTTPLPTVMAGRGARKAARYP